MTGRNTLTKAAAVERLREEGLFADLAEAREAGVLDFLSVPGLPEDITTSQRLREVFDLQIRSAA